jgi:hypothetical protein
MNSSECLRIAAKSEATGSTTFYTMTVTSAILIAFPNPELEAWLHPLLIVAALVAIVCTGVTSIYQTQGNHLLRASQLSDALGAAVGDQVREGYFNSPLPPSFLRLATTTLENTLFTGEILAKMLAKERTKIAVYACTLLLLLTIRATSTGWLLLLAQTLFSADLVLAWVRMERFRVRTNRVHESLKQFFLQDGNIEKPNCIAIVLVAFTDYECAKDEATLRLDPAVFAKLNPVLSRRWEEMKMRLNIKLPQK